MCESMVVCSGFQAWQNQKNAFHNNSINASRALGVGMHRGLTTGAAASSHQTGVGRASPSLSHQTPHALGQPPQASASSAAGKIAGLYDLEDTLGSGHFAVVKLARHVFTGEKVAVKVIDKTKLDEVSRSHLFQEVRCMKLVQHPNVVRLYEVIDTQTKLYLILELGDGGDLYDLIMRHEQGLDEPLAKEYFRQIVRAISYCHRLHVVHRDLKPENVVFFSRLGVVKLTDFGFSNRYCPGQKLQTSCGSLAYSAPEILLGDSYDAPAVDVWSLGVILYMLVCGQAPFQEANDSETLTMIMDCKYQVPAHVTAGCQRLIASMLVREPERRATLQQIARDPWLMEGEGPQMATDCLPLVSRHQVSDADHNLIVQKMANGNIATKDEILEALDKNEYNHITATYFLLAERRLRAQRQQQETAAGGANRKRPVPATLPGVIGGTNSGQSLMPPGANNVSGNNSNCLLLPPGPATVQNSLMAPRTPGDGPQRARKCSIVQEADEDDMPAVGRGGEDLSVGGGAGGHCLLSRRGSRSEGRLNLVLQERIAASSAATGASTGTPKPAPKVVVSSGTGQHNGLAARMRARAMHNNKWQSETAAPADKGIAETEKWNSESTETTVLTDSRTVNLPLQINREKAHGPNEPNDMSQLSTQPKYKTMPAPAIQLNHIHEENVDKPRDKEEKVDSTFQMCPSRRSAELDSPRHAQADVNERLKQLEQKSHQLLEQRSNRRLSATEEHAVMKVSNEKVQQNSTSNPQRMDEKCDEDQPSPLRNSYGDQKPMGVFPQRRARFHAKGRTASCSSSDASDDDSEGRKKRRAHRIAGAATGKPMPARRDSHDDSSDSQDPSCAHGDSNRNGGNRRTGVTNGGPAVDASNNDSGGGASGGGQTTNSNGKQCGGRRQHRSTGAAATGGHTARRRSGVETRLRESQSLNRITEVQEPAPSVHSIVISTTLTAQRNDNSSATNNNKTTNSARGFGARLLQGLSGRRLSMQSSDEVRDDKITQNATAVVPDNNKENYTTGGRRLRVLGKYFQVHRKLCIPLPGLFQRGRMYKAQSCGSLEPESGSVTPKLFNKGVGALPPPLGDFNRELTNALVPLVCSVHLVDITECCRMC